MARKGTVKHKQTKVAKTFLQREAGNPVIAASLQHQYSGNAAGTHQLGIRGRRDRSGARRAAIRESKDF